MWLTRQIISSVLNVDIIGCKSRFDEGRTMNPIILETVRVADLKEHPRNYRKHPEDQINHLVTSIKDHGIYRNIVTARDGTILAGHGVVEACRKIGLETIQVCRLDLDPHDPDALKVLTGDNEISHLGVVDDRALTEILKEIHETSGNGLEGTGFDEMMLAGLVFVTRPAEEIATTDIAAEWVGMPEYDPGEQTIKITIQCQKEEDRDLLLGRIGVTMEEVRHHKGGLNLSF